MFSYQVPVILVRFQFNFNFLDVLSKNSQIPIFMKIRPAEAEMLHAEKKRINKRTDMKKLIGHLKLKKESQQSNRQYLYSIFILYYSIICYMFRLLLSHLQALKM